jgi:hypothetical protein
MPKSNALIFRDLEPGELFVTGPADTLFIKVNDQPWVGCLNGGQTLRLEDGKKNWVPAQRMVRRPIKGDFTVLADRH